jgi:hypothetical protein
MCCVFVAILVLLGLDAGAGKLNIVTVAIVVSAMVIVTVSPPRGRTLVGRTQTARRVGVNEHVQEVQARVKGHQCVASFDLPRRADGLSEIATVDKQLRKENRSGSRPIRRKADHRHGSVVGRDGVEKTC